MAGLGIRLYTDEMIHAGLAPALRRLGYDAESCQEAARSNLGIPDDEQLVYATSSGRAIYTCDIEDFLALDAAWKAAGRSHGGIIVSVQIDDFSELLQRVSSHLDTYSPAVQQDALLWLHSGATP
jgi:hypothetical protein